MKEEHIAFWHTTFKSCEKWMKPKHELWRRLIKQYKMEYSIKGTKHTRIPKVSRFYPLTRMILTSTMFNTPKVLMRVEQDSAQETVDILERIGNSTLDLIDAKTQVQQAGFDSLYCYYGWLKFGVNPKGDEDITPPYVANDSMQNGMFYAQRVDPFNMYLDPNCAPHDPFQSRFIIEKMLVPLEFVKKDKRFNQDLVNEIPGASGEDPEGMLNNTQEKEQNEEEQALGEVRLAGKFVVLREVHDRIHKRLYTFAEGVSQPIEDRPHPFLAGKMETVKDPITGEEKLTGQFTPTGGFLMPGGFPYGALTFDLSHEELYGIPMMGYAEATQQGIVESLARRRGLLKRATRLVMGQKSEQKENPHLADEMEEGKDLSLIWVNDVHNSFAELQQGNPPPDQLGYESDLRSYEEQTLSVSQLQAGGGPRRTATEASLMASFGQLNREWMQSRVADLYERIVIAGLMTMSDKRYTPQNFLINIARDENEPIFQAVQANMMAVRFKVHIEAASMKPMFEELEKEDALALFNYMITLPEIPRTESIKHLFRAFRVPNMERFIGQSARFDAQRGAQTENQLMIFTVMAGAPAPVEAHPKDDHQAHMPIHQQFEQSEGFQRLNPIQKQQAITLVQQHLAGHQELLQMNTEQAGVQGNGNINSVADQAGLNGSGGNSVQEGLDQVDSAVRSSAQKLSQPSNINRAQN
jgi:hypothetical protein